MVDNALKISAMNDCEIVMSRVFNAEQPLVFAAFTEPKLLKRWFFGPDGWSLKVCEIDLKVGGAFRYVWRKDADGTEMSMGGVYRELEAPRRIVHTEVFEMDWTCGETRVTTLFVPQDGRTTVTTTILYSSTGARDAVLKSPMESGVAAGYDRLERILPDMAAETV